MAPGGWIERGRLVLMKIQLLSSIQEFPNLVATIQTFKSLNPLQMRRAVRDYRYEKNEGRMDDECAQYLLQVQKDWERQRVKLGVAAVRQDVSDGPVFSYKPNFYPRFLLVIASGKAA